MTKQQVWTLLLALLPALAQAQTMDSEGYTLTEKGTRYKIVSSGTGSTMPYGGFFQFTYEMRYKNVDKDTLLSSSATTANGLAQLDSTNTPPYILNIFLQSRLGDSVEMRVSVDSAFAGSQMPPFFSSGGYLVSGYRILEVYNNKQTADSVFAVLQGAAAAKAEVVAKQQAAKDDAVLVDYLATNGITAVKAPKGTYIAMKVPGKGRKVTDSSTVQVNYTGKTLSGRVFDSNTDPAFKHVEPITIDMAQPMVIPGWVEALPYFAEGGKGTLYIPSGMGYGTQGAGADIGPNELLVFDIQVLKVTSKGVNRKPTAKPKSVAKKKAVVKKRK
jgi:FKBP-type peptidyl-prolyl cis-trans isomerase FkpA